MPESGLPHEGAAWHVARGPWTRGQSEGSLTAAGARMPRGAAGRLAHRGPRRVCGGVKAFAVHQITGRAEPARAPDCTPWERRREQQRVCGTSMGSLSGLLPVTAQTGVAEVRYMRYPSAHGGQAVPRVGQLGGHTPQAPRRLTLPRRSVPGACPGRAPVARLRCTTSPLPKPRRDCRVVVTPHVAARQGGWAKPLPAELPAARAHVLSAQPRHPGHRPGPCPKNRWQQHLRVARRTSVRCSRRSHRKVSY